MDAQRRGRRATRRSRLRLIRRYRHITDLNPRLFCECCECKYKNNERLQAIWKARCWVSLRETRRRRPLVVKNQTARCFCTSTIMSS